MYWAFRPAIITNVRGKGLAIELARGGRVMMKGNTMLPCRSDHYIFTTAIIAGYFLATVSWSQSYDATTVDWPTQRNEFSIGGKLNFGAATIDLNHMSIPDGLDRQSELSRKREEESSASFTLNLSGHGESNIFPEALNLTARKTDIFGRPQIFIDSVTAKDPNDQRKSDYSISADWGALEDRFTFSFSSSSLADRPYAGKPAEVTDDMLNFTRTLKTGGWLSSFTASVGRGFREETGNHERSRKFGASANFKTIQNGAPYFDITAKVLQDRISKLAPGSGDIDTRWELRTGSKILGAASRDGPTTQPSLSIFFSVKGNSPDEEDTDTNAIDYTAGVAGKVHF